VRFHKREFLASHGFWSWSWGDRFPRFWGEEGGLDVSLEEEDIELSG